MAKTYADEAKILEKIALSKKNTSRHTKKPSLKVGLLEQAAKGYENAGRNWVLEANQNKEYPRRVQYARLNAMNDYGLAKKIRGEISKGSLEGQVFGAASILSLLGALFFMSFNLTGNSIGNLTNENLLIYWAGIGLFILGLVFAFVFLKNKKK